MRKGMLIGLLLLGFMQACKEKPSEDYTKLCGVWAFESKGKDMSQLKEGDVLKVIKHKGGDGFTLNCDGQSKFFKEVKGQKIPLNFHKSTWGVDKEGNFIWRHQVSSVQYLVKDLSDSSFTLVFKKISQN